MSDELDAKLCNLCKWDDYNGYGFSLRAMKGEVGHFIFQIDENSPAFAGGLRDNDFVVEVNGVNVLCKAHKDVVTLIRQHADHVSLLVLDAETRKQASCEDINIEPSRIREITCPPKNPFPSKSDNSEPFSQERQVSKSQIKEIYVTNTSNTNNLINDGSIQDMKSERPVTISPTQSSSLSQISKSTRPDNNQSYISVTTKPTSSTASTKLDTNANMLKNPEPLRNSTSNQNGQQNGNHDREIGKIELRNDTNQNSKQSRNSRRCSISSSFGARAALFNEL